MEWISPFDAMPALQAPCVLYMEIFFDLKKEYWCEQTDNEEDCECTVRVSLYVIHQNNYYKELKIDLSKASIMEVDLQCSSDKHDELDEMGRFNYMNYVNPNPYICYNQIVRWAKLNKKVKPE